MNATMDLQAFPNSYVCRVCLKTGEDIISPMSEDHINRFKSLLDEVVYQEYNMSVCSICDWLLQKLTKLKLQCWTANSLLNQACENENLFVIRKYKSHFTLIYNINDMKCKAGYDGDGIMSEDEIPLLLLSQQGEGKKKKCKQKGELKIETSLEHSKNNHVKTRKKCKKTHKNKLKTLSMDMNQGSKENGVQEKTETSINLREGFSNRMVQETSEYIVIKRTKQQVGDHTRTRVQSGWPCRNQPYLKLAAPRGVIRVNPV